MHTEPPAFRRYGLILIIAIILVFGFIIARGRSRQAAKTPAAGSTTTVIKESPPTPVTAAKVSLGTVTDTVEVSGDIAALTQVSLASKITGRVVAVNAREGDRVQQGQLLVALDTGDLDSQLRNAQDALSAAVAKANSANVSARWQQNNATLGIKNAQEALRSAEAQLSLVKKGARTQERLQAESQVNIAQANLDNAQSNYNRISRLVKEGAVAASQLDTADTQLKVSQAQLESAKQQVSLLQEGPRQEQVVQAQTAVQQARQGLAQAYDNQRQVAMKIEDARAAEAAVRQARANVQLARENRDNAFIHSSVNGIVAKRSVEPGQIATPGTSLMQITVPGTVYFSASVSEKDLSRVHEGQTVEVGIDAFPNEQFTGTVSKLYPTGDASSRTFVARVTLSDGGGRLRPGMFARGAVIVSRKNNVILVPKTALATAGNPVPLSSTETGTASSVFSVQNDKTVRKNIRVGEPSGDNVEVISGLEPGDQVIVSGSRLEEGQKVHVTH